ncbi:hypothetical protein N7490_003439 [Penicillium lividum]|nr:hypothetical protein N7490_003439 [Penicillium lividum]
MATICRSMKHQKDSNILWLATAGVNSGTKHIAIEEWEGTIDGIITNWQDTIHLKGCGQL